MLLVVYSEREIVVVVPGATNPSLAPPSHFPLSQSFCFIHRVPYDNVVHICSIQYVYCSCST